MDITMVFGTIIGGSSPSGCTKIVMIAKVKVEQYPPTGTHTCIETQNFIGAHAITDALKTSEDFMGKYKKETVVAISERDFADNFLCILYLSSVSVDVPSLMRTFKEDFSVFING